jgi:hypothetical protein
MGKKLKDQPCKGKCTDLEMQRYLGDDVYETRCFKCRYFCEVKGNKVILRSKFSRAQRASRPKQVINPIPWEKT